MNIKTVAEVQNYLNQYIPSGEYKYPGDVGLKRVRHFLSLLGSPQNKLKVIHVAGTSGKGSTCFFISTILTSLGKKVGLHISPHILDLKERFQINNEMLSEAEFVSLFLEIQPFIDQIEKDAVPAGRQEWGKATYFEILVVLAFYIFWKKNVDYAIIETGLGGLLDGTNVVDREDKIAVITKLGFDHTEILGNTIEKIAAQKAGIIQEGNPVFSITQEEKAETVIKETAIKKNTKVKFIFPHQILASVLENEADYQIENCSLAWEVVNFLSHRDSFLFNEDAVKQSLMHAHFIGRMDVIKILDSRSSILDHKSTTKDQASRILIIDGAHNPQKMGSFITSLKHRYPDTKFSFLIGMKKGKDYENTLKYIIPVASKIIITPYTTQQELLILGEDPPVIAGVLESLGFKNYSIVKSPQEGLNQLKKNTNEIGIITGSLYLVSEIYKILKD